MSRNFLEIFFILAILSGCGINVDIQESLPEAVALEVNVRSGNTEIVGANEDLSGGIIKNLNIWVFICDKDGKVYDQKPLAHTYLNLEHHETSTKAVIELISGSRYYMVVAASNYGTYIFNKDTQFYQLSTSKSTGSPHLEDTAHWTIIDVLDADADGKLKVNMKLFPTPAKVTIKMAKSADAMRMIVDKITVCSNNAPSEGANISALTREQIEGTGWENAQWWFHGTNLKYSPHTAVLATNVIIPDNGKYTEEISTLLFENMAGWCDLSDYNSTGFNNLPQGDGYYLDIEYRYTTKVSADFSLVDSPDIYYVQKFVPLEPLRRGNNYKISVIANLNDIIVNANTEVSQEIEGKW